MNGIITSSTTTSISSSNHLLLTTPTRRTFSDHMPRRAFPQYTSFGPEYAMGVRAVLPSFKRSGGDGVSVDRRGKLLLDFIPRNNSGAGFAWSEKIYFSLTVEELGLLVSQLPLNAVELSHPLFGPESSSNGGEGGDDPSGGRGGGGGGVRQLAGDVIEKVLTVVPGEGGTVAFTIDYAKDGVPGQTPPGTEGLPVSYCMLVFYHILLHFLLFLTLALNYIMIQITPMKVVIQAGEFEVFKSIFQTSIPYLLGWNTTMDIASAAAISKGLMGDGGRNNMY